ncbi:MAG: YybH family protein [Gemmatimonadales bacterium]
MQARNHVALGAAALLLSACGAGQLGQFDKEAIGDVRQAFVQAVRSGDGSRIAALFTVDGVEMPPNEPIRVGRDAIAAAQLPTVMAFTLTGEETDGMGDLAYDRGTFQITLTMEGMTEPISDNGKYLVLLRKQSDGSWLITHSIWNSDNPPPEM